MSNCNCKKQDGHANCCYRKLAEKEVERLKKAMMEDIVGAGALTGPVYHRAIRAALGLSPEGVIKQGGAT